MPRPIVGRLVVATHNRGKVLEIASLLAPHGVDAVAAADLGLEAPDETGFTFAQNAAQKARIAAAATGLPALADDSGLCVDALDGAPGLHTAEWAGVPRDYVRAMAWLDRELARRGVSTDGASARAVCAMVVAWPDGHEELFEGRCYGRLAWPVRGADGFGFDPLFQPEGHARTFGEMTAAEKEGGGDPLSHRARAFAALVRGCLGGADGAPAEPPRAFAREVAGQLAG